MKFSSAEYNTVPYYFSRDINQFPSFCVILEVSKQDKEYPKVLPLIKSFGLTLGKGQEIDLTQKLMLGNFKSKHLYIVDLREQVDSSLQPITFKQSKQQDPNLISAVCESLLDCTRGLVVLCDHHDDVPRVLFSRSQLGFTTKNDVGTFMFKGNSVVSQFGNPERHDQDKLFGYNNTYTTPTYHYIE